MKRIIIVVLAILTIVFYMTINVSYSGKDYSPIYGLVKENIINFIWLKTNPFDNYSNQGINFDKLSSQIFWSLVLLFIASFLKNKYLLLLTSIFVVAVWLKNYVFYGGIMDSRIYLNSSVYFLVSIFILNIINFIYKDKSVTNS